MVVPLAPLVAAALILFFGNRLPKSGACLAFSGTGVALAALLALHQSGVVAQAPWIAFRDFTITVGLRLDPLAWFVAVLVASIATIVNAYAAEFMQSEPDGKPRFYALMALFAGAMLTVVLADSLVLLFAAWEMMGVTSWGLIAFWYREEKPRRAAQMAFLVTRVGDVGLLLGWLLILIALGHTDIDQFLAAVRGGGFAPGALTLISLFLFMGAIGKSAQLPLTAWLPEAMAGPTPVSALIHSATMVAAGVYLVLRFYPLFQAAPHALTVVLLVGTVTAFVAALTASSQMDLKRILAWSTVSQLGEMMMGLGLGGPAGTLLLLAAQAIFKSGLFLAAGAVERATGAHRLNEMGGLGRRLLWAEVAFAACALALAGFPLFSGFWSGERILAAASQAGFSWAVLFVALIFLDAVYISRAAVGVFLSWPGHRSPEIQKTGPLVRSTMAMLGAAAVIGGFWLKSAVEVAAPQQHSGPESGWEWTILAIAASLVGLSFGAWRVMTCGPIAAFGNFPDAFASALYTATTAPARVLLAAAQSRLLPERALDQFTRGAGLLTSRVADGVEKFEITVLDYFAHIVGLIANRGADGIEVVETSGFDRGTCELAATIWKSGGRMRLLQTGKIYMYTGGVFAWVVLMMVVFAAIWH